MKLTFDISATEFVTVRDILAAIIPPGCRVWVFGSRAKNQARFNSDLDLAFEGKDKLPPIILHKLKEAFSDSPLPYRVDVLDINDVSENFQTIIRQQAIAFPLAKSDKVPKLRFPEFSGEWKRGDLGDCITSLDAGVSVLSNDRPAQQKEKGILKTSCVTSGFFQPHYNKVVDQTDQIKRLKEPVSSNSIIISRMNTPALVGANAIVDQDYSNLFIPDRLWAAKISKYHEAKWVAALTGSKKIRAVFSIRATGTSNSMKNITKGDVKSVAIRYPTLPEQQKIAAFLSAIDTKIEQLTKKKALLEQYKRGVMQKLFSQELRFKDAQGKAFPEWEEKRLGEIAAFSKGKGISKADISEDGVLECIRYGQLYTDYGATISEVKSRTNVPLKELVLSDANDIIIPASGETQIDIATASCVLKSGVALGGDLNIVKTKHAGVFLSYYLNSKRKYEVARLSQGISVVHLYAAQLKLLHINLPSLPEQQKIANFLSAIDQKIDLISTELAHAKTFKKGLLQQMFI